MIVRKGGERTMYWIAVHPCKRKRWIADRLSAFHNYRNQISYWQFESGKFDGATLYIIGSE